LERSDPRLAPIAPLQALQYLIWRTKKAELCLTRVASSGSGHKQSRDRRDWYRSRQGAHAVPV